MSGTVVAVGNVAKFFHAEALRGRSRVINFQVCAAEPGKLTLAVGTETMILGFLTVDAGETEAPAPTNSNIKARTVDQHTWAPTFAWDPI